MCPCVPCLSTSPKRQRQRRTVLPQRPCCERRVAVKTERWYCRSDAFTPVIGLSLSRGLVSHQAVRQSKAALIHSWLSPHSQTEKHKMTDPELEVNTDEVSVQRKALYPKAIKTIELKFNSRLQKHYSWTPKPSNTEARHFWVTGSVESRNFPTRDCTNLCNTEEDRSWLTLITSQNGSSCGLLSVHSYLRSTNLLFQIQILWFN